jgi:carboxyl-terminal processing protease
MINIWRIFIVRFTDGELMSADSIHLADSLKYKTLVNKRVVYGGGGIMPDVFVSADTSYNSSYFNKLYAKNVLNSFTLEFYDKNRTQLQFSINRLMTLRRNLSFSSDDIKTFIAKGESEGIKFNEAQFNKSKSEILLILKGLIATNMWNTSEYFQIINENDRVVDKALNVINDKKAYNSLISSNQ